MFFVSGTPMLISLAVGLVLGVVVWEIFSALRPRGQNRNQQAESDIGLHDFLNGAPVMMWMMDANGKAVSFNDTLLKFTGRSLEEEISHEWTGELIHQDDIEKCMSTYKQSLSVIAPFDLEYRCRGADGSFRWVSEVGIPRVSSDGQYLGHVGTCIDITDRKKAEKQLFDEKERAQVTLESIGDGVVTTDSEGCIEFINSTAQEILGWTLEDAFGMPSNKIFKVLDENTGLEVPDPVKCCIKEGRTIKMSANTILCSRSGKEYTVQNSVAPIFNQERCIVGAVLVFSDVTEALVMAKKLSYQASHDPLTGLVNRREFERRLQQAVKSASDGRLQHVVCYLNLDRFKIVNDTSGHAAGDHLLRQVSSALTTKLRKHDTLARVGGDEFCVLLEECSLEQAERVANLIRSTIEDIKFVWEHRSFSIGVSIGIVPINSETARSTDVFKAADIACYKAKNKGRNRNFIFYATDQELSQHRGEIEWVATINQALNEDLFRVFFQPIVPIQRENTKKTEFELLVRMENEKGDLFLPGAFFPAAERYNLASKIDRAVIDGAFTWFETHPDNLEKSAQISINLSGQSLADDGFLNYIIERFKASTISPSKICFEITESAAILNLSSAVSFISALKRLGCSFALDDFGSGFSSFGYLKNLPVDYLKIDGIFVKDIVIDPIDLAMVKSINDIGHVLGKETIAEFVENGEILAKLQTIGVDYAQGFGIAKPRPIQDLVQVHSSYH